MKSRTENKDKNSETSPEQILAGAERDSQNLFSGALVALTKNFRAANSDADRQKDPVEKWGKITGRTLGYIFAILLLVNLFTGWFF